MDVGELELIVNKKGEWLELIIPIEWNGYSIDDILKKNWKVPKGLLHNYRINKAVKVNGKLIPWSKELYKGDKLQVHMFPKEDYGVIPTFRDISILYEDDFILIVNKPAGIEIHSNGKSNSNTLSNNVAYYYLMNEIETSIRYIHRLDKDTTGAVVFVKNALTCAILDRLLEDRLIKRTYLTLVNGIVKDKQRTINKPIGRDRHHSLKRRVSSTGQHAITYYEVLQYYINENMTLVKVELFTGRTHQIRVHMSHIGHPIVGDELYGGKKEGYHRQSLHAAKITLVNPINNKEISCIAPFVDNLTLIDEEFLKLV